MYLNTIEILKMQLFQPYFKKYFHKIFLSVDETFYM